MNQIEFSSSSDGSTVLLPNVRSSTSCGDNTMDSFVSENKTEIAELLQAVPQLSEVFTVVDKVGAGTFSSVFLAKLKSNGGIKEERFALKHLIPTSHPSRIENEIRCLKDLDGNCNVIPIKACVRNCDNVVIVMPYIQHDKFQDYVDNLSPAEVQSYMFALLTAVAHVHKYNIIHRDIKHSNFLYNRKLKQFALVDFGLAQKVPGTVRTSSRSRLVQSSGEQTTVKTVAVEQRDSEMLVLSPKRNTPAHRDENRQLVSTRHNRRESLDGETCQGAGAIRSRSIVTDSCGKPEGKASRHLLKTLSSNVVCDHPSPVVAAPKTPPVTLKSVKQKSPRQTLLTKRVLDAQGQTSTLRQSLSHKAGTGVNFGGKSCSSTTSVPKPICRCYGRPMVCNICLSRSAEKAPRAGTPGYRPPEVLMKYADQTTAVDIWSVGVIFLSLLSGHYPIFKAGDDLDALAQIMCIFGTEPVSAAAKAYGKRLDCSPSYPGVDVKSFCQQVRKHHVQSPPLPSTSDRLAEQWSALPDCAYDLLRKLLDVNPFTRITANDALSHPFFDVTFSSIPTVV